MSELLWTADDGKAEVWLGSALDASDVAAVMGGRMADALIVDAPFSERTHAGHEGSRMSPEQLERWANRDTSAPRTSERAYARRQGKRGSPRNQIVYPPWTSNDVEAFVDLWSPLTRGWMVSITDHVLFPSWSGSMDVNDRCTFQPLPFVETGSRVRMAGDGPSSWTCWVAVGRPRGEPYSKWGALRGAYVLPGERAFNGVGGSGRIVGGKPVKGMLLLVEDYSNHGDLVVDATCGSGTTGVAARTLGRRFIGIDSCREHAEITIRRLRETREQLTIPHTSRRPVQAELPMGCGDAGGVE